MTTHAPPGRIPTPYHVIPHSVRHWAALKTASRGLTGDSAEAHTKLLARWAWHHTTPGQRAALSDRCVACEHAELEDADEELAA